MGSINMVFMLMYLVICNFCNQNFKSVNRHKWRCKDRFEHEAYLPDDRNRRTETSHEVKCLCNKVCKNIKGLRIHQRSCTTVKSMNWLGEYEEMDNADVINNEYDNLLLTLDEVPCIKPGVNLPKSKDEWDEANTYFHSQLINITIEGNINNALESFNNIVYDYLKHNMGLKIIYQQKKQILKTNIPYTAKSS